MASSKYAVVQPAKHLKPGSWQLTAGEGRRPDQLYSYEPFIISHLWNAEAAYFD